MAKLGFKVIDSDIHVVEPKDLWLRYLEPKFVNDGPRPAEPGKGLWQIGDRADSGSSESSRALGRHRHLDRLAARGFFLSAGVEHIFQDRWPVRSIPS
jgi:hypothetical protein